MTELLTAAAAADVWGALEQGAPTAVATQRPKTYRHYRPLADAASAFIKEAQDTKRIFTGVPKFDEQMRGIGSGHLCVITGYSHSGKTQLFLRILRHNKAAKIAMFIPDEPAPLVLSKLASIETGVAARQLEEQISAGDADAIRLLRNVANEDYPNLAIFDKPLTAESMREGYDEICDVWGDKPDLVVVDYMELVQAGGDTVQSKFDFIKGFGSRNELPIIAIHQTSRSAGAEGRKMTISSGSYGGEQHATFMIGVRRKKSGLMAEKEELLPKVAKGDEKAAERLAFVGLELRIHEYTITSNLVKNKRPGGGLVDDIDMEIDTSTGRLSDIAEGDLPDQFARDVHNAREERHAIQPTTTWTQPAFGDEEPF